MSELEALRQTYWNSVHFILFPLLALIGYLILLLFDKIPKKFIWQSAMIIIAFCVIGIIISIAMNWGLREKIQELEQNYYTSMTCDQLHQNIVHQLKKNNSTYLDFQKDYYYHSCEVPLRDEVLKLRSEP